MLEIGEEYLISVFSDDLEQLTANSCGLVRSWEAITEKEKLLLEPGCVEAACDGIFTLPEQCCPVKLVCEVPGSTNPLPCGECFFFRDLLASCFLLQKLGEISSPLFCRM